MNPRPGSPTATRSVPAAVSQRRAALTTLQMQLQMNPGDPELLRAVGRTLLELDRVDEARTILADAVAADPNHPLGHHLLGIAWRRLDNLDEARAAQDAAVTRDPALAAAWLELGRTCRLTCRHGEALTAYLWATILEPDRADAHFCLGLEWLELAQFRLAVEPLARCLELRDDEDEICRDYLWLALLRAAEPETIRDFAARWPELVDWRWAFPVAHFAADEMAGPLHLAAAVDDRDLIELLLSLGSEVDRLSPTGVTALLVACRHGHLGCMEALIEAGADLDHRDHTQLSARDYMLRRGLVVSVHRD